jgi:hypothetical protein
MTPIRKEYVPSDNVKGLRESGLHEDPVSRELSRYHIRMSIYERRGDGFRAMATKIPQTYLSMWHDGGRLAHE